MISPSHGAVLMTPFCRYSMPAARVPSNRMRVAWAPVSTRRFGAPHRRPEIGARGRHAPPAARRDLVDPDALRLGAVEVVGPFQPGFLAGKQIALAECVAVARHVRHVQRSAAPAVLIAIGIVLGFLEIGQDVQPAPAGIAQRPPVVEVGFLAADMDHGVDRTRPAEHLAARPIALAPVECRLRLGAVHPVDAGIVERLTVTDRHLDPQPPIAAPGLEQQHLVGAALAEPRGEHAPGRSRADDDVVEAHCCEDGRWIGRRGRSNFNNPSYHCRWGFRGDSIRTAPSLAPSSRRKPGSMSPQPRHRSAGFRLSPE